MQIVKKRLQQRTSLVAILCGLLLIFFTAGTSFSSIFSYKHNSEENQTSSEGTITKTETVSAPENPADPNTNIAGSEDHTNFDMEIPGVGAFFSNILDSLINLTRSSENRFQLITNHFPLVFPDLYKVLITL